ncbi:MAG TPA: hypothetical protein VHC95_05710 [Opitutales bacterium]|nr:hypothetical protein [Opitutales bacterium]
MKATAKLFRNGGSQAIRLPKQFRFPGKMVVLQRTAAGVLIKAKPEEDQRLTDAALAYQAFLQANSRARAEMDAWESAPLAD